VETPDFFSSECLFENGQPASPQASPLSILFSIALMAVIFRPLEKLPEGLAIAAKSRFQRENKMEKGALVGEASLKYFVDGKLTWL
jgi:hypothetical protein